MPTNESYVRLDDGTVWPNPADPTEVQWRIRYGTPTRSDLLIAAAHMHAYQELVMQTDKRRTDVVRGLRRAMTERAGR